MHYPRDGQRASVARACLTRSSLRTGVGGLSASPRGVPQVESGTMGETVRRRAEQVWEWAEFEVGVVHR